MTSCVYFHMDPFISTCSGLFDAALESKNLLPEESWCSTGVTCFRLCLPHRGKHWKTASHNTQHSCNGAFRVWTNSPAVKGTCLTDSCLSFYWWILISEHPYVTKGEIKLFQLNLILVLAERELFRFQIKLWERADMILNQFRLLLLYLYVRQNPKPL